jgi:hypothetical protein
MKLDRRNFLLGSAVTAAHAGMAASLPNAMEPSTAAIASAAPKRKPNLVVYLSDQFLWDFVGANGLNSSSGTPNLDQLALIIFTTSGASILSKRRAPSASKMSDFIRLSTVSAWRLLFVIAPMCQPRHGNGLKGVLVRSVVLVFLGFPVCHRVGACRQERAAAWNSLALARPTSGYFP